MGPTHTDTVQCTETTTTTLTPTASTGTTGTTTTGELTTISNNTTNSNSYRDSASYSCNDRDNNNSNNSSSSNNSKDIGITDGTRTKTIGTITKTTTDNRMERITTRTSNNSRAPLGDVGGPGAEAGDCPGGWLCSRRKLPYRHGLVTSDICRRKSLYRQVIGDKLDLCWRQPNFDPEQFEKLYKKDKKRENNISNQTQRQKGYFFVVSVKISKMYYKTQNITISISACDFTIHLSLIFLKFKSIFNYRKEIILFLFIFVFLLMCLFARTCTYKCVDMP